MLHLVHSVESAEEQSVENKVSGWAIYINTLNARKVKGVGVGLGDVVKPVFEACARSPAVVSSPNPEKKLLDCVTEILGYVRNVLLQYK